MKRSGEPERRTELKRTPFVRKQPSPKLSGSSLSRAARKPAPRKPLRSKPKPATPDEVEAKRIVRQRSGGVCEVCDQAWAREFSHRLPKSAQGPWDAANGLDVCGHGNLYGCHGRIHQHSTEAYARGWAVERGRDFRAIPVEHARHGLVLLRSDGSIEPTTREAA